MCCVPRRIVVMTWEHQSETPSVVPTGHSIRSEWRSNGDRWYHRPSSALEHLVGETGGAPTGNCITGGIAGKHPPENCITGELESFRDGESCPRRQAMEATENSSGVSESAEIRTTSENSSRVFEMGNRVPGDWQWRPRRMAREFPSMRRLEQHRRSLESFREGGK
jgi:hypothetical protein